MESRSFWHIIKAKLWGNETIYDLDVIYELIHTAFDEKSFNGFCSKHVQPVYRRFKTEHTDTERIRMLVVYADQYKFLGDLLRLIRQTKPSIYASFAPRLRTRKKNKFKWAIITIIIPIIGLAADMLGIRSALVSSPPVQTVIQTVTEITQIFVTSPPTYVPIPTSPKPSPTLLPTASASPIFTSIPIPPTDTPQTPTWTPTFTPQPAPVWTATSTPQPAPIWTATHTTPSLPTNTPVPSPTPTPLPTHTPTPSPTNIPIPSPTPTPLPTHTSTPLPTHTPTPSPTNTPVPSPTPTPLPTPTLTSTPTETPPPLTPHCNNPTLSGIYVYSEKDYQGKCVAVTGDIGDLDNTPVGNDGPRSLIITGPFCIKMYEDKWFQGRKDEFNDTQDDLTWRSLGDQYSSIRLCN